MHAQIVLFDGFDPLDVIALDGDHRTASFRRSPVTASPGMAVLLLCVIAAASQFTGAGWACGYRQRGPGRGVPG